MDSTELALQMMDLQRDARRLMREHGWEPGHVHQLPDRNGYRIAFGYVESAPGKGVWQRYFEIPVSDEEYRNLNESVRRLILDRLAARLEEKRCS
jgi:hypothetical protein